MDRYLVVAVGGDAVDVAVHGNWRGLRPQDLLALAVQIEGADDVLGG